MKMKWVFAIAGLYTGVGLADDVQLMGEISQPVRVPVQSSNKMYMRSPTQSRTLQLLAIQLSSQGQENLVSRFERPVMEQGMPDSMQLATSKQLGMGSVPVLDQGMHGTCAMFAATAAIDAALGKKDEISQVCQLELGNYLEEESYYPSGWEGSLGHMVLSQMETFGVVSKAQEHSVGCGGLYEYPALTSDKPTGKMTIEEYHRLSEDIDQDLPRWHPILHIAQSLSQPINTQKILTAVKDAINQGDRVVFGVLLPATNLGVVGAVGKSHVQNDTWVITPRVRKEAEINKSFAGHEMVITGYDDNAVSVDDQGGKHQGLLTLRNSWGENIGFNGDFYMSYDYFTHLVIEAHRILSWKKSNEQ